MTEPAAGNPILARREIIAIMFGLLLALFLASLDQTIVAPSLSTMARDLNGWQLIPWVVSSYLVASTVTTPIYGRLSDLYGRRPILLISIALFVLASVLCALSQTMVQLIAARFLQGLGGGGLRSVSQAVVADIIPPRERGRYQGYFSSMFAISSTLGPVLGGFFADYLSWHWIFWINIPFGLLAFIVSNHHLRRLARPTRRPEIDWWGALLILVSTTPILLGLGQVEQTGSWTSGSVLGPIAIGLLFVGVLIVRELAALEPMLPVRLFANRTFSIACAISFLVSTVMIGLLVIVPLDYQLAAKLSANDAGLRLMPITGGTALGSFIAGSLVSRTGRYRIYPIIGSATITLACLAMSYVGLGRFTPFDLAATLALGVGIGFQFSPITVTVQNSLNPAHIGVGISCLLLFRLIGGAFGVASFSAILISGLNASAQAIPGHEILGSNPGIALFHLDQVAAHLPAAFLAAATASIQKAFSYLYLAATVVGALNLAAALALKDIPLRGHEIRIAGDQSRPAA